MIPDMTPEFGWPAVEAKERPKPIYFDRNLSKEETAQLLALGWLPKDVRLMPNLSDADRAESVKAYLEGVRIGSIDPDPKKLKFLELEARVYGLTATKTASDKKREDVSDTADVKQLLTLNSGLAFQGAFNSSETLADMLKTAQGPTETAPLVPKRKAGRPSGIREQKPRNRVYVKKVSQVPEAEVDAEEQGSTSAETEL